eukprot:COSAG01_NODE_4290_length_5170_cov_2.814829_3_plen_183_part_00
MATALDLKRRYWVSYRREQDASGRLAELEEQFVVQLDEVEALKREQALMVQTLQVFKAACDAAGIVPEFPPEVEAVRARLYSSSGGESAPEGVGAGGGGEGVRLRIPTHLYLHVLAAGHPGRTSATLAILFLPTVPTRACCLQAHSVRCVPAPRAPPPPPPLWNACCNGSRGPPARTACGRT